MTPFRRYGRFVGVALLVTAVVLAVGFLPTRRLAGDAALPSMAAGSLISLVAAALAGWLLVAVPAATPVLRMQRAMLAMAVRFGTVIVLGVAALLGGVLARRPLLFWLATSYVVLLPLEVKLAVETE
jgi:hypothetical protein